jgi:tetratricopeptide (TPR) repeat protein
VGKKRKHQTENAPATGTSPPAAAPPPEPRSVYLVWLLAAILTFWSFGFTTMMGSDLWWHLASGQWITANHTLTFKDPWSFTRFGQPWMSHEWLSDVIYHFWSSWFGMATLVWWKWTVLTAAFTLLFSVLRKLTGSSLAAYLASLLAIAVGAAFFDVRPQLYSLLGFALVLRLALLPSRFRWTLPFVFFVWVNLHGGFFFGLLALTTILAVAFLTGQSTRNSLPIWLGCLFACLVSPAGPDAYVFPLHYALNPSSPYLRVGEWKPPWEPGGIRSALYFPAIAVFVATAIFSFAAGLHRKLPRLTFTSLALGLLTLAMSLKSRRFISLFGIGQSLLLAVALAALLDRLAKRWPRFSQQPRWRLVPALLAVGLGGLWLFPYPLSSNAFLYLTAQDSFPVEAMNVAEANQLSGKVFAYYEWGGYVDLHTQGRLKVYIDGRADTVFDDQTYRRYTRVLGMAKGWEAIVAESGADFFLWPKRHHKQIKALRDSGDWRTLYSDHVAVLLMRSDRPSLWPLRPSADSAWRELMLGFNAANLKDLPEAEKHFARALELMPNLRMACEWLANTQSRADRLADAEATLDRCQKMFPNRARRRELGEIFRKRAEAMPEP